ncbi:MAG: adenylate/guanylate cyclase domain-containing protein [Rhodocyclaceae bacterium]|nr:adenylate/guanylate cyclase domain-containing protein [Rhodocyclaceae bacterium]
MQRVSRAVLFMDIRGFTAWSEQQAPEAVVGLLNQYYRVAEATLGEGRTIKIKYTADEVMAVFAETAMAATDGSRMLAAAQRMLAESNLAAGAGLHHGPVVEGVLGGVGVKAYDFIGDTVNTAKRLCDAAKAGELLISRGGVQGRRTSGRHATRDHCQRQTRAIAGDGGGCLNASANARQTPAI